MMTEEMLNPWHIQSIYDLQYFVCPNCVFKNHSKQEFINHAYEMHPKSINYLYNIQDDSLKDIIFPKNVEKVKEEYIFKNSFDNHLELDIKPVENIKEELILEESNDPLELETQKIITEKNESQVNQLDKKSIEAIKEELIIEESFDDPLELEMQEMETEKNEHIEDIHDKTECDICGKKFTLNRNLKRHISTVHEGFKKYDCDFCGKDFGYLHALQNHINAIHRGMKHFKCNFWEDIICSDTNFKVHIQKVLESKSHACQKCGKVFSRAHNLNYHINHVHYKNNENKIKNTHKYKCGLCSQVFYEETLLKRHVNFVHYGQLNKVNFTYKAVEQNKGKKTSNRNRPLKYATNIQVVKQNVLYATFKCSICSLDFSEESLLKRHFDLMHSDQNMDDIETQNKDLDEFKTEKININFCKSDDSEKSQPVQKNSESKFENSEQKSRILFGQEPDFTCETSGQSFNSKKVFKRHINFVYEQEAKLHKCSVCGIDLSNLKFLQKHLKEVHGQTNIDSLENYECETCGKKFAQKRNLKRHINIVHEGSKIYNCDVCGKDFGYLQCLRRHLKVVHRCFSSKIINRGETFSNTGNLNSHINIVHEDLSSKNINCEVCGETFPNKENLNSHIKSVHEGLSSKDINCEICGETFSDTGNLNSHINSVHQDFLEKYC